MGAFTKPCTTERISALVGGFAAERMPLLCLSAGCKYTHRARVVASERSLTVCVSRSALSTTDVLTDGEILFRI